MVFGDWLLRKWNEEVTVLAWARLPMLLLTLALGWIVFVYGRQLGGEWAGLLCLTVFVSTPAFLTFGPLVLTDIPVTLYSLSTIWTFAYLWENPPKWNSFLFAMSFAATSWTISCCRSKASDGSTRIGSSGRSGVPLACDLGDLAYLARILHARPHGHQHPPLYCPDRIAHPLARVAPSSAGAPALGRALRG